MTDWHREPLGELDQPQPVAGRQRAAEDLLADLGMHEVRPGRRSAVGHVGDHT
jgi:hypothetical protein